MPSSDKRGVFKFLFSLYVFLHDVTSNGSRKTFFGNCSTNFGDIMESEAPESIKTVICCFGKKNRVIRFVEPNYLS